MFGSILWWLACVGAQLDRPDVDTGFAFGSNGPYASCDLQTPCPLEGSFCLGQPNRLTAEAFSCGRPCTDDAQCPIAGGRAVPVCAARSGPTDEGFCVLTCETTAECPRDMVCGDVDTHGPFADRTCGWPVVDRVR